LLVPVNWLRDFVDIKCSVEDLAAKLTMSSLEVEGIIYPGKDICNVVIGRVERIAKHPNADKLRICYLHIGQANSDLIKIVTGAQNVQEKDVVPVALLGAKLTNGLEIKKVKLRGEESLGMLCSEKELGLSEEASGIMQLPKDSPLGCDFKEYSNLIDPVLEISILPNRPDCMSILGVAREVSAVTGYPLKSEKKVSSNIKQEDPSSIISENEYVKIHIQEADLCSRYMGAIIENVKIAESPLWLQQRLRLAGIRPINNIVDITNYILIEYGQPLHAFDYKKLALNKDAIPQIIIRRAKKDENIQTLDQKTRTLLETDLVIANEQYPIALAGVMGGSNTDICEQTTTILLESACFNPTSIRKTSSRLGCRTESSIRFERGIDWYGVETALKKSVKMILDLNERAAEKIFIDLKKQNLKNKSIKYDFRKINRILGIEISEKEIKSSLEKIGISVSNGFINVPSWRYHDVDREADILEEVARIYGYLQIPSTLPNLNSCALTNLKGDKFEERVKNILIGQGLNEVITSSLSYPDLNSDLNKNKNIVKIKNPINKEESILRSNVLLNIIDVLKLNMRYSHKTSIRIFEIGNTYHRINFSNKYKESPKISGAVCQETEAFFSLKAIISNLFKSLNIRNVTFKKLVPHEYFYSSIFHPNKAAIIAIGKDKLGVVGSLHPNLAKINKFTKDVCLFDLDFDLMKTKQTDATYSPISKYPATIQDLVFVVKKDVVNEDIVNTIITTGGNLVEEVILFDRYEGSQVPEGWISLAYSITYRDSNKTLVEKEVIKLHAKIADSVAKKFDVRFR